MQHPRPKYQVFISSTYEDLRDEREQVTWAVLMERHIPVGMEAMPATDDRGWRTIQRLIDQSDYYVLVIGGRYGSVDEETGLSWTHREYRYARDQGVPALVFIRQDAHITKDKTETDAARREALEGLISEVTAHHKAVFWREAEDLCQAVAHALSNHIKDDEDDGRARPGWFRGDQIPSAAALEEFARLSSENEQLKAEIQGLRREATIALSLRSPDGNPVDGTKREDAYVHLEFHSEWSVLSPFSEESEDALLAYVDRRNRTAWFETSLRNDSETVVRNVIVDLRISGVAELIHVPERVPQGALIPKLSPPKWPTDPSEHNYLADQRWVDDELRLRLRVKDIHPGAEEHLVPLGLILTEVGAGAEIAFVISTEEGPRFEGSLEIRRRIRSHREVTRKELMAGID